MSRPLHALEHTARTSEGVFHYTCNAPTLDALAKYEIKAIGDAFGADPREILLIPTSLYGRFGYKIADARPETLSIVSEQLLRRL